MSCSPSTLPFAWSRMAHDLVEASCRPFDEIFRPQIRRASRQCQHAALCTPSHTSRTKAHCIYLSFWERFVDFTLSVYSPLILEECIASKYYRRKSKVATIPSKTATIFPSKTGPWYDTRPSKQFAVVRSSHYRCCFPASGSLFGRAISLPFSLGNSLVSMNGLFVNFFGRRSKWCAFSGMMHIITPTKLSTPSHSHRFLILIYK